MKIMNISGIRQEYRLREFDEKSAGNDPLALFAHWLQEAIDSGVDEPTAMVVSTVSHDGKPSSRIVLLKDISDGRFTFFTNYNSEKGRQISVNHDVALLFFWPALERQVRIEGIAARSDAAISDRYFNSRPVESRLGAIASPQSAVIGSRQELEKHFEAAKARYRFNMPERPENWGGFEVTATSIEFWQGRENRLHDRIRFRKGRHGWKKERLAP